MGEASNPGPLHRAQVELWPDADFPGDRARVSSSEDPQSNQIPTERDVMRGDVNPSRQADVAQFDLTRLDSSCEEDTRGPVETSTTNRISVLGGDVPRRRSVLVSRVVPLQTNVAAPTARDLCESDTKSVVSRQNFADLDDSHDQRLRRVRQRVKRSDVAAVVEVFRALSGRVGPVSANQEVPRVILRQTWSALNIPLMWAASSGDRVSSAVVVGPRWRSSGIVVCG